MELNLSLKYFQIDFNHAAGRIRRDRLHWKTGVFACLPLRQVTLTEARSGSDTLWGLVVSDSTSTLGPCKCF
jgi:hypothetical protein